MSLRGGPPRPATSSPLTGGFFWLDFPFRWGLLRRRLVSTFTSQPARFLAMTGLLIKRLLDDIFDRWIGNGDVVDGQISQKSRSDAGDIFRFYLDVLLLPVFLILNGSPILGQVM